MEQGVKAPFNYQCPLKDYSVVQNSHYGAVRRYQIEDKWYNDVHNGVDLIPASPSYSKDIMACASGVIAFNDWNKYGGGRTIWIDHPGGYQSRYCHLAEQPEIKVGEKISIGEVFGKMGMTGKAQGVHLHWGMYLNGQHFDPMYMLK